MTFMQIGRPVVVFGFGKAGLQTKGGQKARACFSTLRAAVFSEREHR